MQQEVLEKDLIKLINICKEFNAEKVFLFGSCLEELRFANDIDIAVKGIKQKEFFLFYGKVSMMLDNEVDIIDLDDVREHIYKRILSKGKIVYEKQI